MDFVRQPSVRFQIAMATNSSANVTLDDHDRNDFPSCEHPRIKIVRSSDPTSKYRDVECVWTSERGRATVAAARKAKNVHW